MHVLEPRKVCFWWICKCFCFFNIYATSTAQPDATCLGSYLSRSRFSPVSRSQASQQSAVHTPKVRIVLVLIMQHIATPLASQTTMDWVCTASCWFGVQFTCIFLFCPPLSHCCSFLDQSLFVCSVFWYWSDSCCIVARLLTDYLVSICMILRLSTLFIRFQKDDLRTQSSEDAICLSPYLLLQATCFCRLHKSTSLSLILCAG